MKAVSVLEVSDPAVWAELEAAFPLAEHVESALDDRRRIVKPSFEKVLLPEMPLLVRYARRSAAEREVAAAALVAEVEALSPDLKRCLVSAQRHAVEGVVYARHAWDPVADAAHVRDLYVRELISVVQADDEPEVERYRLHPDLPPPPPVVYDFSEACMPEPDDLEAPSPGPMALLDDMASLAAALEHVRGKLTHAGVLTQPDARKVGAQVGSAAIAKSGSVEADPRWGRALRGLHALRVIGVDPLSRMLQLDLGLETVFLGEATDAVDRLVHRLVDADLHSVIPAVRAALAQAGTESVDEMIFLEGVREQHRDVLITPWLRKGRKIYPVPEGGTEFPFDDEGFERFEDHMIRSVLGRMARFGLIRRAPGVFAATEDGRRWAGVSKGAVPPIWVSGDLEIIVPPGALTPWERFQIERLGRCLQRDVVDRFRLEPDKLRTWLGTHDVAEAVALLERRCPGVPQSAKESLQSWAKSALRVVLTRGVLIE